LFLKNYIRIRSESCFGLYHTRAGARHFYLGGPLEGPVLQQGELSMVCLGLSERELLRLTSRGKFWGAVAPLAPP